MGNTQVKASASFAGKQRGKLSKSVHWSHAERPPPPGKPRLIPGTPHTQPGLVTIRWDPPPRHGGAPVTGYLVEHRRAGTPHWVRSTPAPTLRAEASLSGLEPGWRYQFRVSAESAAGRSEPGELSEPLTVTLDRPSAQPPLFTVELGDAVALENDKVEFVVQFRGTPAPAISWFKDGFEIFSSRRMKVVTEAEQSSLVIFQAAFSDEGEFKCTATNRVGHAVSRCKLRLEAPPRIRLPRQYEDGLLFERDEVIRLKVSVLGRPLPRVTWFHNGEPVAFGGRHEVVNTERGSQLRVAEARRSDRGEYLVRATSRLGEDHASVLVTVTDIPHPPGKVKVVSALGRSVTLSWSEPGDDGGCKIGNYIVEYYRLGWNVWLKAATCRQLTTSLGDLIEGSEYKFRVKAENPYGVSEPSEESDTVFIPDPKRGLMEPPAKRATLERDVPLLPGGRATTSEDHLPTMPREPVAKRSASLTRAEDHNKQTLVIDITGKRGNLKAMSPTGKPDVPESLGDAIRRSEVQKPPSSALDTNKVSSEKPNALRSGARAEHNRDANATADSDHVVPVKPVRAAQGAREAARGAPAVPAGRLDEESRPLPLVQHENDRLQLQQQVERRKQLVRQGSSQGPREQDDRLMHGSSELMLLLVPQEEGQKGQQTPRESQERQGVGAASAAAALGEEGVAPPMSLSAPELGGEDPGAGEDPGGPLRNAISSTELLHDRANARFFQEAEQRRMLKDRERQQQQQQQQQREQRRRSLEDGRDAPAPSRRLHKQATDTSEEGMESDSLEESEEESADERDFEAEEHRAWRSRLQRGLADQDEEEDTYHPPRLLAAPPPPAAAPVTDTRRPQPAPAPAPTAWDRLNGAIPQQQQQKEETTQQQQAQQEAASEESQERDRGKDKEQDRDKDKEQDEEEEREDEEAQLRATAEAARRRRMATRQASLEEEAMLRQAVSSHYGELISDLASRRSLRPRASPALLDADELKAAAEDAERRQASPLPEEDVQPKRERAPSPELAPAVKAPEHELKSILKSAKVETPATLSVARAPPQRIPSDESGPTEEEEREVQQRFREDTPVVRERLGGASPMRSLGRSPLLLHQLGRSRSSEDSYSYGDDDEEEEGPVTVPTRYHLLEEEDGPVPLHRDDGAPLRIPTRALARSSSREVSEDVDPERVYRERLEQLRREQREWEQRRRREEQLWELRRRQLQQLQAQAPQLARTPPPEVVQRRVRSWFEFLCDLALLGVACWLYLFVDELLVVPLLVFLVYGQLSAAIRRRLPRLPRLPFRRRQPAPQDQ